MNASELFEAGKLNEAVAAALDAVKSAPADTGRRRFLCELLCFAGDLERADRQLDALAQQDPKAVATVSLFRQMLRAEEARRQFFADGRLPEFLTPPSPVIRTHLEASIHLREGRPEEAAQLLADAEAQRPRVSGTSGDRPFQDFRDIDDLTAPLFEVFTSTGKYYWVPVADVERIEFHAPTRPRDLLWQRVHMVVRNGPDGEVFLPTLYAGAHADSDDRIRLGRVTAWQGGDGVPIRGSGQRIFLVGEEECPTLELKTVTFNAAGSPAAG
jgi:type VI secretion system protein ImpE